MWCFDKSAIGSNPSFAAFPSIYGNPASRHDDYKQVFFEIGPCVSSQTKTCPVTTAAAEAELAKLDFVFMYNSNVLDLTGKSSELVKQEARVTYAKINPKNRVQFTSTVT